MLDEDNSRPIIQGRCTSPRSTGGPRFVSMQDHLDLIYRGEGPEMLPLCREEKIGVIPYSPSLPDD